MREEQNVGKTNNEKQIRDVAEASAADAKPGALVAAVSRQINKPRAIIKCLLV